MVCVTKALILVHALYDQAALECAQTRSKGPFVPPQTPQLDRPRRRHELHFLSASSKTQCLQWEKKSADRRLLFRTRAPL